MQCLFDKRGVCRYYWFDFIKTNIESNILQKEDHNNFRIQASKFKVMFIVYNYLTYVNIIYILNSGDEVNITLWEDNADKLDNYLSQEYIQNEPVVLIIQLAKTNTWGSTEVRYKINYSNY